MRYSKPTRPNSDIRAYTAGEPTPETLALLRLLALGNRDIEAGQTKPARAVIERLKSKRSGA
jgi:hypothetical protein